MFINNFGGYESASDEKRPGTYDDMPALDCQDEDNFEQQEGEECGDVDERLCITMRSLSIKLIQEDKAQR